MAELPTERDFEDFTAWSGRDVLDPDGDRLGAVEGIFLDEATGVPEWVLVRVEDGDAAFVPLVGANVEERTIRVEQPSDRVAAAPRPEPAETLSVADERRLYEHYGLAYSEQESATLLPEGAAPAEERPRLRKYVGAPVPPPAQPAAAQPAAPPPSAPDDRGASDRPDAAPQASTAGPTPTPIPEPAPTVVPPEGGFQVHEDEGSRLPAVLQGPSGVTVGLGAAIAGLIALLILRRRRR
jgi:hypothetical protein